MRCCEDDVGSSDVLIQVSISIDTSVTDVIVLLWVLIKGVLGIAYTSSLSVILWKISFRKNVCISYLFDKMMCLLDDVYEVISLGLLILLNHKLGKVLLV